MATAVTIAPSPILQFFNNSGAPNVGGSILTQVGSINAATYQDSAGNVPLPNPIPLNSRGEVSNAAGISCQLFLDNSVTYTFTVFDANGNQLNQSTSVAVPTFALSTALASTTTTNQGGYLVGLKRRAVSGAVATTEGLVFERASVHIMDEGATCDGVADDTVALNLATGYFGGTGRGGSLVFPALTRISTNGGITLSATHGVRYVGDAPAYTVGAEFASCRINHYGTGNAITLSGLVATQSAFTFENLRLENKGNPQTANGILAVNAGFSAGLRVIGAVITQFSSGVQASTGQPYGYAYFKDSAFYYNATWGLSIAGNIIDVESCAISNNGPLWSTSNNLFNAAPVGGGLLVDGISTAVSVRGGCDFEGLTVGIFVRNSFGVKVEGCYFESIAKCAIQATTVVGLEISGNYMSTNNESRTILLRDCSNVRVSANGYAPNVYALGLTDYDLDGCNVIYLDTNLNRAVQDTMFCMKSVYGSKNVDMNDAEAGYLATPSTFVNMTGPVLQAEVGPFGAPINRYTTTLAGGSFVAPSVAATAGQYLYFSVLIRNATVMQAIVRDTSELNPIVVQTLTQYNKEWSVLTVGGVVMVTQNYRLTLVNTNSEVFDLGGLTYYLRATPLRKQAFSFANARRVPDRTAALTYSATMTPAPALGNEQAITPTNGTAFTVNQPAVIPPAGDELTITVINTFGALGAATFNGYKLGSAWTQPANGFTRSIRFRSNGTLYREVDRTAVDVSN